MIVRLKVVLDDAKMHRVDGFNSMIVRLKEFPKVLHKCNIPKFQFYDSPIKSLQALVRYADRFRSFNSMIVRLKVPSFHDTILSSSVSILW